MKKTRKLIPAIAMLLVSLIVMSSASFAWFSMNKQVTATGMQIVAKSDNTFLQIGTGDNDTPGEIHAANPNTTVEITVSDGEAKVYPSAPVNSDDEVGYTEANKLNIDGATIDGSTIKAGAKVTDKATAALATNWYTANAELPSASAIKADSARQLTEAKFANYVIKKTVYLTVAEGSNNANNLRVTASITQKGAGTAYDAVKILVVTDDGAMATLDKDHLDANIKGSDTAITDATVRTVDIYVYYDGNDTTVFTNNAVNLAGADINFTFNVDAVPAT